MAEFAAGAGDRGVLLVLQNSEAKAYPFRGMDEADMICHKPCDVGWL